MPETKGGFWLPPQSVETLQKLKKLKEDEEQKEKQEARRNLTIKYAKGFDSGGNLSEAARKDRRRDNKEKALKRKRRKRKAHGRQ
jgi:hypothetical protein